MGLLYPKFLVRFFIVLYMICFFIFVGDSSARSRSAYLQAVRVADFVYYTQIAVEFSGTVGTIKVDKHLTGNYPILTVKITGAKQGTVPREYPIQSDVLLDKISIHNISSSRTLTLTIPCRESVDLTKMVWNKGKDMLTLDLPLKTPNHSRIPSVEEIKRFKEEQDGKVVIIDPGHGAFDPGAKARYTKTPRLQEKDVVLDLGFRLERMFKQHPKVMVFMTRYGDYLPVPFGFQCPTRDQYRRESLRYRVQLAKEYLGNVFVSLHLNAPPPRRSHRYTRGYEIYYLGDKQADNLPLNPDIIQLNDLEEELIAEEKKDAVTDLVFQISKENVPIDSKLLAGRITSEMRTIPWLQLREPAMKSQRFLVIKQLLMPSVLIEFLYITNPTEHEQIRSTEKRTELASAVYKAVCKFLFNPSEPIPEFLVESKSITQPKPKAIPTPPQISTTYYTVRRGDSLDKIARAQGATVTLLKKLNGYSARNPVIHPGDKIKIPTRQITMAKATPKWDTVRKGDSLDKIAKRWRTTVYRLKKLNHLQGRNPIIYPKQKIRIR